MATLSNCQMSNVDMSVCALCGEDSLVRVHLRMGQLTAHCELDKVRWLLSAQIESNDLSLLEPICAICIHRINTLIDTICDIKKKYIYTQALLKSYSTNLSKKGWSEFKQSPKANKLLKRNDIVQKIDKVDDFYIKKRDDDIIRNSKESSDEERYINEEWLSDVESVNDFNTEIIIIETDNINNNHDTNVIDEKIDEPSLPSTVKLKKDEISNVLRINKRGYLYATSSQMHISHNANGEYSCKLCKMTFKWKHRAEQHVRSAHMQEKPFECQLCKLKFTSANYLSRHLSDIHEKAKFVCQNCGKEFNRRYLLTEHEKIHQSSPLMKCPHADCLKSFHSNIVLKAHLVTSHSKKEFICEHCGLCFRTRAKLMIHHQMHYKKKDND